MSLIPSIIIITARTPALSRTSRWSRLSAEGPYPSVMTLFPAMPTLITASLGLPNIWA
jgi:hypothetical protein